MPEPITVLDVLSSLFPRLEPNEPPYPIWPGDEVEAGESGYDKLPIHPFDVFAATAHLIELSGAYHHIVAGGDNQTRGRFRRARLRQRSERMIALGSGRLGLCREQARIWRERLPPGNKAPREKQLDLLRRSLERRRKKLQETVNKWTELFGKHGNEPVFRQLSAKTSAPAWWRLALELLITSDEACEGVGFATLSYDNVAWDEISWFERPYVNRMLEAYEKKGFAKKPGPLNRALAYSSLSDARQDVVCVLPKARTSPVGCTLRSLSHHLALLPPKGIARGRWYPATDVASTLDDVELNILLVPFPFSLNDTAFHGFLGRSTRGTSFGFFEVRQEWLGRTDPKATSLFVDKLYAFVVDLATDALTTHQAASIDGIIFPELALRYAIYGPLKARLKQRFPDLEIFISGLSDNGEGRQGNFVAVSVMPKTSITLRQGAQTHDYDVGDDYTMNDAMRPTIREKHHRWKLNRYQLEDYGLSGILNPKLDWWEDLDLLSRCVDFTVFRKNSVLAAMICEDLARVDPCQELLRAVAPNLVVALLMDGPQLPTRWPARYATILSDDPGSSVLTLTSRALMTRQHRLGLHKSSDRTIALWRDDHFASARTIACPQDCQGVWLKLWSSRVVDVSLDGREDFRGKTWIYGKDRPLRIANAAERYPEILGADDCLHLQQRGQDHFLPDAS